MSFSCYEVYSSAHSPSLRFVVSAHVPAVFSPSRRERWEKSSVASEKGKRKHDWGEGCACGMCEHLYLLTYWFIDSFYIFSPIWGDWPVLFVILWASCFGDLAFEQPEISSLLPWIVFKVLCNIFFFLKHFFFQKWSGLIGQRWTWAFRNVSKPLFLWKYPVYGIHGGVECSVHAVRFR